MSEINNPIGRLLYYLERASKVRGDYSAATGWAHMMECRADDTLQVAQGILLFTEVVREARKAIEQNVPGNQTIYLDPLDNILAMLKDCSLDRQWGSYQAHMDVTITQALRFGNHVLENTYPAADPKVRQSVNEFIERLDQLIKECLDSELDPQLKSLFLKHLNAVRESLYSYLIGGAGKTEEVVDEAVGALVRNLSTVDEASPEVRSLAKKVLESFTFANKVISKAQEMVTLASPIIDKLLPLIH
ncbi:hypothetical protein [Pseudomonas viridiflava]|uniref:hypothetical protein n=1 Tax=Pseudomonas viridiflava TaxID=33069 RepID=UPI000F011597|nr:hypothetical protein [Pseudomonas viridiflava]